MRICRQSVDCIDSASVWTALIAACSWYGPGWLRRRQARTSPWPSSINGRCGGTDPVRRPSTGRRATNPATVHLGLAIASRTGVDDGRGERGMFVHEALYAWCVRRRCPAGRDPDGRAGQHRADFRWLTVLAGNPAFLETVIIDDPVTRADLAAWMRARGRERREAIWFRDAEVAEAVATILFLGLPRAGTHRSTSALSVHCGRLGQTPPTTPPPAAATRTSQARTADRSCPSSPARSGTRRPPRTDRTDRSPAAPHPAVPTHHIPVPSPAQHPAATT
jgi:hypothetical protein